MRRPSRREAGTGLTLVGIAQGFVVPLLPDNMDTRVRVWFGVVAAVVFVAGLVLLWRSQKAATDDPSPRAGQDGSQNVQAIAGRDAIAQQGEHNVVVNEGGTYYETKEHKESDGWVVDVGPEHLIGFYKKHTTIQADRLFGAFKGKRMRVAGKLRDVRAFPRVVALDPDSAPGYLVVGYVSREAAGRLETLQPGKKVTIVGEIKHADNFAVVLKKCELE